MLQRIIRPRFVALALLLAFCVLHPADALAGDKLRQLKEDVLRIQQGTLLIAPILPDSFALRKLEGAQKSAQRLAYLEGIRLSNINLRAAIAERYDFGKVAYLPEVADYSAYFAELRKYDPKQFYVLQFGQAAQYASGKAIKASKYDSEFLGIYALDGQSRMYLSAGKVDLCSRPGYCPSIIRALNTGLHKYAGQKTKRGRKTNASPLPYNLVDKVALLPQERLYGNDSLTFLNGLYYTVVTTLPLKVYRGFGGVSMPGGTFVTADTLRDTAETREQLAILMEWGNTLEFEAVINVPVATKLNLGKAAPQGNLSGGGNQIIMPYGWPLDWIVRIYHTQSAQSWTLEEFRIAFPKYFPTK